MVKDIHKNSTSVGWVYRAVWLYRLVMLALYGRAYQKKYDLVAQEIPAGSVVVDLCCGDSKIASSLITKNCKYIGLDINERFVEFGKRNGLDIRLWDGNDSEIPAADIICIQSSLYQFIPNDKKILNKMIEKARHKVIISEPVENLANSGSSVLRKIVELLTQVNGKKFTARHSEQSLDALVKDLPKPFVTKTRNGRDLLLCISTAAIERTVVNHG